MAFRCALGIQVDVFLPLLRNAIAVKDRFHGTFDSTCFTINTLIRMNVDHAFIFIKALNWAYDDTVGVFAIVTRLANNVWHDADFTSSDCNRDLRMGLRAIFELVP